MDQTAHIDIPNRLILSILSFIYSANIQRSTGFSHILYFTVQSGLAWLNRSISKNWFFSDGQCGPIQIESWRWFYSYRTYVYRSNWLLFLIVDWCCRCTRRGRTAIWQCCIANCAISVAIQRRSDENNDPITIMYQKE